MQMVHENLSMINIAMSRFKVDGPGTANVLRDSKPWKRGVVQKVAAHVRLLVLLFSVNIAKKCLFSYFNQKHNIK